MKADDKIRDINNRIKKLEEGEKESNYQGFLELINDRKQIVKEIDQFKKEHKISSALFKILYASFVRKENKINYLNNIVIKYSSIDTNSFKISYINRLIEKEILKFQNIFNLIVY